MRIEQVGAHRLAVMFGDPDLERPPVEDGAQADPPARFAAPAGVAPPRTVPARRVAAFAALGLAGVAAGTIAFAGLTSLGLPAFPPGGQGAVAGIVGDPASPTPEAAAATPDAVPPTATPAPATASPSPAPPTAEPESTAVADRRPGHARDSGADPGPGSSHPAPDTTTGGNAQARAGRPEADTTSDTPPDTAPDPRSNADRGGSAADAHPGADRRAAADPRADRSVHAGTLRRDVGSKGLGTPDWAALVFAPLWVYTAVAGAEGPPETCHFRRLIAELDAAHAQFAGGGTAGTAIETLRGNLDAMWAAYHASGLDPHHGLRRVHDVLRRVPEVEGRAYAYWLLNLALGIGTTRRTAGATVVTERERRAIRDVAAWLGAEPPPSPGLPRASRAGQAPAFRRRPAAGQASLSAPGPGGAVAA